VLNQMFVSGFSPSVDTMIDVIRGFLRFGEMRKAFEMHKERKYGYFIWRDKDTKSLFYQGLSDEVTYTSLMMNAYLDEGNWDYAEELYGEMFRCGPYFSVLINGFDKKSRTTKVNKQLLILNY
ncbi:pentatricopeptide repeat-containing protein, partial [Trifolium medium]|nr:pentatricopeptide repeat-containing protein [Trifolium medium]